MTRYGRSTHAVRTSLGVCHAFARGNSYTKISTSLASTGDTLILDDEVIMWWSGEDIYFMCGDNAPICWVNDVAEYLGLGRPMGVRTAKAAFTWHGRAIGQDEVIKLEIPT